ncbi:MAG: aromatic ring-hydroxylating dioxygenase subunit alpha [Alphaproteobacteria bacterium]
MDNKSNIIEGSGYHRRPAVYRDELTEVGRGTPMGELMRRYWQVVALSRDATSTPKQIRLLGEDLILFRDGKGRAGLVYNRCCHRGTTLYYGKVEESGIRCCYHGWLFDVEGHCIEQPCEPDLGAKYRDKVRQPWYPVQERYGLIWAYLGPPEKMPILPRYEIFENLKQGEFIEVDDTSIGTQGDAIMPCNWLQHFENVMDPTHVRVLHGTHSGPQFGDEVISGKFVMPEFRETPRGIEFRGEGEFRKGCTAQGDGRYNVCELLLPCIRAVPNPFYSKPDEPCEALGFMMPIDDTHFRIYTAGRTTVKGQVFTIPPEIWQAFTKGANAPPSRWSQMTEEERRAKPGDWEAQTGQGPITIHSEEHLVSSDIGVLTVRKMFSEQLKRMERGEDPKGLIFDRNAPPIKLTAGGNWSSPQPYI